MFDGVPDGVLLGVGVGVLVGGGDEGGGDDTGGDDDAGGEKCDGEPEGFGFGDVDVPGTGMPAPTDGCGASEFLADGRPLWCPRAGLTDGELLTDVGPPAGVKLLPPWVWLTACATPANSA